MTEPYTRDEIEAILRRETCRPDDYETDRCQRHNGLMPLVGDSCTRKRSDLLAIIRQLLDQARREPPSGGSMTDHLQAAKDLMGLVDALTGGPVDPEKAMTAAQTHAMIAIAESLRFERTEVVHVRECAQETPESPRTAQEPESAPTATPEPERPQEGLTAARLYALPSGSVVTADGDRTTWIRHPHGDWVSDGPEEALTSDELARFSNGPVTLVHRPLALADEEVIVKLPERGHAWNSGLLIALAGPVERVSLATRDVLLAVADGIDRKEGLR